MSAAIDLVAGGIGGSVGKCVEYPFDTVKTRMQSGGAFAGKSAAQVALNIIRNEGALRGFYAGVSMPVAGCAAECAVAFSVFYTVCDALRAQPRFADQTDRRATYTVVAAAGVASGTANGLLLTPVELVKCRVQSNPALYPTVRQCIRVSVEREGLGVFANGLSGTMAREITGTVGFFLVLETALESLFSHHRDRSCAAKSINDLNGDAPWYVRPVCGGIAGFGLLAPTFPADSVKTMLQVDPECARLGFVGTARRMFRAGGARAFFHGFSITMLRAWPANATVFSVYDLLADWANKRFT
jgi:ornithine carrier protein